MTTDQSPESLVKAEEEGCSAQRIGVPVEHNPYEAGTDEYEAWEHGWEQEATKSA